ncbi:MAG: hypothetical protein WEE64_05735 [Dehalococcoidia bacterium]
MIERPHARLVNAEGELIAEGPCQLDEAAAVATMEPLRESHSIRTAHGGLALELDSGRQIRVTRRPMIVRLRLPGQPPGGNGRRTMYRLRLAKGEFAKGGSSQPTEDAQDARAAGDAGEGSPVSPARETPAAR